LDTTVPGFAGVILIKKAGDGSQKIRGCWDSIHVFEVKEMGDSVSYTLTSTVMLWLQTMRKDSGLLNLGGSLTRQFNKVLGSSSEHIIEIGKMVEEVENKVFKFNPHVWTGNGISITRAPGTY
jgi:capping protein beta